ncbi:MAG: OmpH family outer membrane protein [Cyclobacteriaceae bacterium]
MKTRSLLIAIALTAITFGAAAQGNLKIGYTTPDYILNQLPEAKQIEADLKSREKVLQNQLQAKYKEFETKMADYQANAESWDELIRADKEQELNALNQSLQKFQQEAEQAIRKKQEELLKPAYEKIGKAIEDVAKENGYTHIFNLGAPGIDILLYAREQDDVTNLILKKLGVTPPAE